MNPSPSTFRNVQHVIAGQSTSDGAGVKLRRCLGGSVQQRVDPLLMLDEFYSDRPEDYLAGFPAHPHRGFETVTYMLDGHMLHEDHLGNRGHLGPGDVQWMTAGRGIIHSEMPQQQSGRMRGFQLWINLPAAQKMQAASYRDIPAAQLTRRVRADGCSLTLIAGRLSFAGDALAGPVNPVANSMATDPLYADLTITTGNELQLDVPETHNAVLYVYENLVETALIEQPIRVQQGHVAVLNAGRCVRIHAPAGNARVLLIAARPLHEPVVQYGPFVMNTREEIEQAMRDFRSGQLTG